MSLGFERPGLKWVVFFWFVVSLMAFSTTAFATNLKYRCEGGSFDPVDIEVTDKTTLLINGIDTMMIDLHRVAQRIPTPYFDLLGYASSLREGHSVVVLTVSKALFRGAKVAELNTFNRGPRGSYKESYKCTLTN